MTSPQPLSTPRHSGLARGVSVVLIAAIAGLAACEREPSPSDIAPTNPPTPGEAPAPRPNEQPDRGQPPAPMVRPDQQQPAPAPAPRDDLAPPARPTDPANPGNPSNPGNPTNPGTPPANPPLPAPGSPPPAWPTASADAMTRYLGDVAEATTILRGVRDASSASTATSRLTEVSERINTSVEALEALPADQKTRLREQHRETMTRTAQDFRAEADRVSRDTALGSTLKGIIDDIQLFE